MVSAKTQSNTIGMLGGMSWESTAEYYRLANALVAEREGGLHSADILLSSVDFADITALQKSGAWDQAGALLAQRAKSLEDAGASVVLLCTNTMHKVADYITRAISIPFIDIRDVVVDAIKATGMKRVGLLATAYTMEQTFWTDYVKAAGIDVVIPNEEDRSEVHRIIFEELCLGTFSERSRATYVDIIDRLQSNGCEGVVLGCTEIELLITDEHSPIPVFPTTRLHVEAALRV